MLLPRTMVSPANRGLVYSFGIFEVFVESRELFRQGRRIKMQDQPFELLLLLLEHHGETVDREVIRLRLWPKDTFVDFGQSLGTAITKLRQALGDDANNPIFVETIPRRGYRFIAPVAIQSQPPKPEHPEANSAKGHTPADASGDHVEAIFSKLTKVRGIGFALFLLIPNTATSGVNLYEAALTEADVQEDRFSANSHAENGYCPAIMRRPVSRLTVSDSSVNRPARRLGLFKFSP